MKGSWSKASEAKLKLKSSGPVMCHYSNFREILHENLADLPIWPTVAWPLGGHEYGGALAPPSLAPEERTLCERGTHECGTSWMHEKVYVLLRKEFSYLT